MTRDTNYQGIESVVVLAKKVIANRVEIGGVKASSVLAA
jgi:hypothetical protein